MFYIIVFLTLVIVASLGYIFYLKLFKKYTRERFAFIALTVMSGMVITVLFQIYSAEGFISAFIQTSNGLFNAGLSTHKTDWRDHTMTIILLFLLMRYIISLYKNWAGPISIETYDKQRFSQPSTMLQEAKLQLQHFLSHQKIHPYIQNKQTGLQNLFTNTDQEKMPWHVNVYELLTFSSDQYKLDLKNDYYDNEQCFISTYGKDKKNVIAILCCKQYPKDSAIRDFVAFVRKHSRTVYKYIIAVKEGKGDEKNVMWQGTELCIKNEEEMLNNLVDFSSYNELIQKRYTENPITEGGKHTLEDIYVPAIGTYISDDRKEISHPPISDVSPEMRSILLSSNMLKDESVMSSFFRLAKRSIGTLENYILRWTEEQTENKHLAILGEYGYGKSVLSLKITYELLKTVKTGGRIPILIELRGKSPRTLSANEILASWALDYHINAASLMKLHKAGKLVIIFEGFDEMDMVGDKEMRQEHFQRLWEFAMPNSKIIITGRPNFFLDDKELKLNLGIEKPHENSHYCQALYLEKFDKEQIELAMRNIDQTTRSQVLDILNNPENKSFYDLLARPAILYLVAVIWKDRKLSDVKDKINSAFIISEFINYSYSRQAGKQTSFPLSEKEREYFMLGIAVFMLFKSGYTNQIAKADLEHVISQLYKTIPDEIATNTSAVQGKRKSLKVRLQNNSNAQETVITDVRSCGILVNDLTRRDYLKFAHKSFLEYQVSSYFVESLLQEKTSELIVMNAITKALDISINYFTHSNETIAFTSEILISKININADDDSYKVCRRLFKILYPINVLGNFPRLATVFELFGSRGFVLLSAMCLLAVSFFPILLSERSEILRLVASILLLGFQLTFAYYFLKSKTAGVGKRNKIWIRTCVQLKIKEDILSKIVSRSYYQYLLSNTEDSYFMYAVTDMINKWKKADNTVVHTVTVSTNDKRNNIVYESVTSKQEKI